MNKAILAGVATAAFMAMTTPADAALIVFGSVGGAPTGVTRDNLDALNLGSGGGLTATGIQVNLTPGAAVVTGEVANQYAAPFLSGGNGTGFGSPNQPNGDDTTKYITTGSTGAQAGSRAELILPGPQMYFGLLWGSVDAFNRLEFFNGGTSVGVLTGTNVLAAPNGDQGVNGTLYVNINSTLTFNRVVATSSNFAFEFDNVAFNPTQVPEPASMLLLGLGLVGAARSARRRRQ